MKKEVLGQVFLWNRVESKVREKNRAIIKKRGNEFEREKRERRRERER